MGKENDLCVCVAPGITVTSSMLLLRANLSHFPVNEQFHPSLQVISKISIINRIINDRSLLLVLILISIFMAQIIE